MIRASSGPARLESTLFWGSGLLIGAFPSGPICLGSRLSQRRSHFPVTEARHGHKIERSHATVPTLSK